MLFRSGLAEDKGAIVAEPQADGPAAKAGIVAGDVITAVNDETVKDPRDLARKVAAINPGEKATVTIWRKGKAETLNIDIKPYPVDKKQADKDGATSTDKGEALDDYGLTVTPDDSGKGVVVTDIDPDSDAADKGMRVGDTIITANNKDVKSASDVTSAIKDATKSGRKAVLLQVQREGRNIFIALPIDQG